MSFTIEHIKHYNGFKTYEPLIRECDFNKSLPLKELPVWLPYEFRHEHFYDETGPDTFTCSECGHTIFLEFDDQPADSLPDNVVNSLYRKSTT